jgi:DNA-binding transcriptional regulator YhcF (GntR family)
MERFDEKTISDLLLSIKPLLSGTKKPLNPIESAKLLNEACKVESRKEVAKKLGINRATLRQYLHLLKLPKSVQELIEKGKIGKERGYRISLLKDKEDQKYLAKAIVKEKLTHSEVRGVVFLKQNNFEMPIKDSIRKIMEQRERIKHHLLLTGIDTSTFERIEKETLKLGNSPEDLVKEIIEKALPASMNIIAFKMRGKLIKMTIDAEGFRTLKKLAKELETSLDDLTDRLVNDWLQKID